MCEIEAGFQSKAPSEVVQQCPYEEPAIVFPTAASAPQDGGTSNGANEAMFDDLAGEIAAKDPEAAGPVARAKDAILAEAAKLPPDEQAQFIFDAVSMILGFATLTAPVSVVMDVMSTAYSAYKLDFIGVLGGIASIVPYVGDAGGFALKYGDEATAVIIAAAGIRKVGDEIVEVVGTGAKFGDDLKLEDHFIRHGADFGLETASDYEKAADAFLTSELGEGVRELTRTNGDVVRWDPETDAFGVVSSDGTIRTFYKPDPDQHGFATNEEYFNAQFR